MSASRRPVIPQVWPVNWLLQANALIKQGLESIQNISPGKHPCGQRRHQVAAHLQRSSIDEFKLTHCRV
jgi:hypothetical protein